MKSNNSDEITHHQSTYLNEYQQMNTNHFSQQQHRFDSKHNLKLEHFKFSPSNKSTTPHNSAINNTTQTGNNTISSISSNNANNSNNGKSKNVVLTIQNQNLLVSATLNASIQAIAVSNSNNSTNNNSGTSNNASRHRILRNKVINNNTPPDNNLNANDDSNPHSANNNLSSQQAIQQKLTYLKVI